MGLNQYGLKERRNSFMEYRVKVKRIVDFQTTVDAESWSEAKQKAVKYIYAMLTQEAKHGTFGHCEFENLTEEEEFFVKEKKQNLKDIFDIPLGVSERFGGTFCEDCGYGAELNSDEEELPDGWEFTYEPFKCSNCGKYID
jgi:hypothetical protein